MSEKQEVPTEALFSDMSQSEALFKLSEWLQHSLAVSSLHVAIPVDFAARLLVLLNPPVSLPPVSVLPTAADLDAVAEEDRVRVATSEFKPPVLTELTRAQGEHAFAGVAEISARDLILRALRNAGRREQRQMPRWAAVSEAFGLGSTYSIALCRNYGLEPDEKVGGVADGSL